MASRYRGAGDLEEDDFVQEDASDDDDEDFEGRVEQAYRAHRSGPAPRTLPRPPSAGRAVSPDVAPGAGGPPPGGGQLGDPHLSVYDDVRSTLLDTPSVSGRPASGSTRPLSASTGRPLSASTARPQSASTARPAPEGVLPVSALSAVSQTAAGSLERIFPQKPPKKPKTAQFYIKQHVQKQQEKQRALNERLHRRSRETQYALLQHMAELNDWCVELNMRERYRVIKKGEVLHCHVYENDLFVKEISMDLMMKRYNVMKKRLDNLTADRPPMEPVSDEQLQRRQEQIRAALLHTMQITGKLKEQLVQLDKRQALTPFLIE